MSARRGAPRDKEAEKQSSDANNQKTDGPHEETGIIWSISGPLRPADTAPAALVVHRTNTAVSHKQERSLKSLEGIYARLFILLFGQQDIIKHLSINRQVWKYMCVCMFAPFQGTNKMSGYHSIVADWCLSGRSEENTAWIQKSQQRSQSFLWRDAMIVENECVSAGMCVEPPVKDGCDGCEFISLGRILRIFRQ